MSNNNKNISREDINEAYNSVFSTPKGRIVLSHLASICHIEETTFNPDPLVMAKNEGERRVVLEIFKRISAPVINTVTDTDLYDILKMEENEHEVIQ